MDNFTGTGGYAFSPTNWMQEQFPPDATRASMPVPIVLPITDFTRRSIGKAAAVTLTNSAGVPLAILRQPETYELRVRELILRTWGVIDDEHPYVDQGAANPSPPHGAPPPPYMMTPTASIYDDPHRLRI